LRSCSTPQSKSGVIAILGGTGVTHSTPPLAMGTVSPTAGTAQSWEKGFWERGPAGALAFMLTSKMEHRRDFSF